MTYKALPTKPMVKGLNACTDYATQPPGTFPRGSNFLLNKRGALDVCDGSQLIHAFNGQVQAGRGKILAVFLFSPTGVSNYYLALAQALDLPLGSPQNLTIVNGGVGGTLAAGTYSYKVTATDGVGGETTASNEIAITITAGQQPILTWNIVPNAVSYNIYRGTFSGGEILILGAGLPVSQVAVGNLTLSFTDSGAQPMIYNISSAYIQAISSIGASFRYFALFTVSSTVGLSAGQTFTPAGTSNTLFQTKWTVGSVVSPTQFSAVLTSARIPGLVNGSSTSGGTFTTGNPPPSSDTTQQIVLFKMPVIAGSPAQLPVSYNNSNIVAIYPALLTTFTGSGGSPIGGGGGGSTGGGGGSGGGGGTGGGGNPGTPPGKGVF